MITVLDSLNASLHQAFASNPQVILLGEDVLDPYGGAFKVTRGLSTSFPGRVIATPISEAGIVGLAAGMALRGQRPVVEIMFGDFITLAADQLINHAAKFRWMYNDQVRVPLVVRTPMGGRRGYGPTHSQTLEKLFLGVPGLQVLAPSSLGDPGALLKQAILTGEDPTLFIENKLLYGCPILIPQDLAEFDCSSQEGHFTLQVKDAPLPTLTIAVYGYMSELARQAALRLAYEHEIFTELIITNRLAPLDSEPILASAAKTGRLLAVEEGSLPLGWGAEVLACAAERLGPRLRSYRRLAALNLPVPASGPLESAVLPGVDEIIHSAVQIMGHGFDG